MKKICAICFGVIILIGVFFAVYSGKKDADRPSPQIAQKPFGSDASAVIKIAMWDPLTYELFSLLDIQGRFQQFYPNVTIEIEYTFNEHDYRESLRVRTTANQLPDIMFNKPFTLTQYKDYLLDLSDMTELVENNVLAAQYAIDGRIVSLPEKRLGDYVFYWSDMFEEAGVGIPGTWSEFCETAMKLQNFYAARDLNFSAIAIGGRDEWPTFPFMEFMPCLVSGNGQNWNTMAAQDRPFAEGTDINVAYHKVFGLFTSGVFGRNPIGIGHNEAVVQFSQKKSAMIPSGPWCLTQIERSAADISTLKSFYMPVRDSVDDPFYIITQGDDFIGVTTNSHYPEIAKDFIRFYFSDAWYADYVYRIEDDSTMKDFPKEKAPALKAADDAQPDAIMVMYDGGGDDFAALQNEVKFDYKKLGAQMFVDGFDINRELDRLNILWANARVRLGISN